jgi:manganese/zinc/iron transport system substrate-binding protein
MRKGINFLYCILFFILMGCNQSSTIKTNVVCTTSIIADVVSIIAGDKLNVEGLMGAGVDPHLYKASAKDVRLLSDAAMIFYNGLHLEAKMDEFLIKLKDKKTVVSISDSIDKKMLIKVDNLLYDPHIWFDLELFSIAVLEIKDQLVKEYPEFNDYFEKNYKQFMTQLNQLQHTNINLINMLKDNQKVLITAHDAFSYFGRAYNFEVIALQGVSTQSKAGLADVEKLASLIVEKQVPAIFIESSVSPRQIRAVQDAVRAKGWNVEIGGELFSDALGEKGTKEGTYLGMFDFNVQTIVAGLSVFKKNNLDNVSK